MLLLILILLATIKQCLDNDINGFTILWVLIDDVDVCLLHSWKVEINELLP